MMRGSTRLLAMMTATLGLAGVASAQYNPATQGRPSLYVDPKFQSTGQVIFYRGTGLCLSVQNAVFRDYTPILLEPCDGSPRQQFKMDGERIRLAPNTQLCLDRQRIQQGTDTGELNLENCSEKRTKWRYDANATGIRGTSHVDYSICLYPQGNRIAPGVRMMAGPPGCPSAQPLAFGPLQAALTGGGQQPPRPPAPPAPNPSPRQGSSQPANGKSFYVKAEGALCIDVAGGRAIGGAPVQLWNCHGRSPQKFIIDAAQGRIRFAARPDLCIDQEQGGGRWLELTECKYAWNRWTYGSNRIVGPNNQCWDVPSGKFNAGQRLQVWACNNREPQAFVYND